MLLSWLKRSSDDTLRPPRHWKDFQKSWFEELLWMCFDRKDMQGYLPMTADLWRLAGAHSGEFFKKHNSCVLACFERATVAGQEVIFYPPLVELINSELEKCRNKKNRHIGLISEPSTAVHRESGDLSPSQSEFDFDSKNHHHKHVRASHRYTQADFDARDLRKMKVAQDKFDKKCEAAVGNLPAWMQDEKKVFEWICFEAGITVERGLEVEATQKKWPAAGD